MTQQPALLQSVVRIAMQAGEEILSVYRRDGDIVAQSKADDSPLTEADTRAHKLIVWELQVLTPTIPVLSEESAFVAWETRRQWQEYWLVDPLDGTKEFLNRNDEFTVNIALIRDGEAVLGVVHAPALDATWSGVCDSSIHAEKIAWKHSAESMHTIRSQRFQSDPTQAVARVVASRRHGGDALKGMLETLEARCKGVELVSMGSSLKMCVLAEGAADIYPRLAPTSEWDTAAAQAVLCAAGGSILNTDFTPLRYNTKDSLLNPSFIALADREFDWKRLLAD